MFTNIIFDEEQSVYIDDQSIVYQDIDDIINTNDEYFKMKDVAYLRMIWNEQPPKRIYDIQGVCYWSNEIISPLQ